MITKNEYSVKCPENKAQKSFIFRALLPMVKDLTGLRKHSRFHSLFALIIAKYGLKTRHFVKFGTKKIRPIFIKKRRIRGTVRTASIAKYIGRYFKDDSSTSGKMPSRSRDYPTLDIPLYPPYSQGIEPTSLQLEELARTVQYKA